MSSAAAEEERATAEEEPAVVMEEPAVVMEASGVHSMPKSRQPGARTAHNKNNWQDEGSKISGLANSGNADAEATTGYSQLCSGCSLGCCRCSLHPQPAVRQCGVAFPSLRWCFTSSVDRPGWLWGRPLWKLCWLWSRPWPWPWPWT